MKKPLAAPKPRVRLRWQTDALITIFFVAVAVVAQETIYGWPSGYNVYRDSAAAVPFLLLAMIAVAIARSLPGLAIALIWLSTLIQLNERFDILLVQLAALYVVGMAARFGSRRWVLISGASIPLGAALGTLYMSRIDSWLLGPIVRATTAANAQDPWPTNHLVAVFVVAGGVLALPWLFGLMLRLFAGKQSALQSTAQAREEAVGALELARLRAENAALARDVHDVVGHSLAVIIAQADSIAYIPDDDVARIRQTTQTIADAARRSLGEVRNVLSQTAETTTFGAKQPAHPATQQFAPNSTSEALQTAQLGLLPPRTSDISAILHNVRATGYRVTEETLGEPQGLPAALLPVIRRIIQEMLANALHHGTAATPIDVRHYWGTTSYTLSVTNYFQPDAQGVRRGTGISGMRERLASVAGTLSIDTDEGAAPAPSKYTIAATLPLDKTFRNDAHGRDRPQHPHEAPGHGGLKDFLDT